MTVAELMTRQVVAIDQNTSVVQAIRLMTQHRISGLPVVGQNERVVGILTEGDFLRRVEVGVAADSGTWLRRLFMPGRAAEDYVLRHGRKVSDVMTTTVVTVTPETPLPDAVALMQRHNVKRLPVVRDERLCGVLSRADIVRRVGEVLAAAAVSADDEAIQKSILDAMNQESWARNTMVTIAVKDGVVQLDGCLFNPSERNALGVLAETAPGVKKVENRIVCIEPYMGMVIYDPNT